MGVILLDVFGGDKSLLQRYMFTGNNSNTVSGTSSGNTSGNSTSWVDFFGSIGSGDEFDDSNI